MKKTNLTARRKGKTVAGEEDEHMISKEGDFPGRQDQGKDPKKRVRTGTEVTIGVRKFRKPRTIRPPNSPP